MKNHNATSFPPGLKECSKMFLIGAALMFSLVSCNESDLEELSQEPLASPGASLASQKDQGEALAGLRASSGTSITEVQFTATAMIAYCYGENITFTGTIQNRVTTTTDAEGVIHYSRSFNTRGLTAIGTTSGTEYDVVGGAEMFAIKDAVLSSGSLNLGASLSESDIVIHQGTLVFENQTDGSRIVARHIIRKVPGQDAVINKWECQGI
ncbi:MAG: hypothetical protein WD824_17065 [Cyclobacteriaceae bacterium]